MMLRLIIPLLILGSSAQADIVLAARTIRPQTILSAEDVTIGDGTAAGIHEKLDEVIGQEARVALYAGRPIRHGDVGAPALVDRNQLVALVYDRGGLVITTEGRALARGGAGDVVRVMNLSSRATLNGVVQNDGSIEVQ